MAKYMLEGSYTADGAKGLLEEGGSSRRAAVEQAVQGLGGRVEAFYYAFGGSDVVAILDVPDAASAAAISLAIASTGVATVSCVALLTPEEIDEACQKVVDYRPPGS